MSGLLEIFGRAITVDPSDLIWHWLNEQRRDDAESVRNRHLNQIIDLMGAGNHALSAAWPPRPCVCERTTSSRPWTS
jgi:hypothetical protein